MQPTINTFAVSPTSLTTKSQIPRPHLPPTFSFPPEPPLSFVSSPPPPLLLLFSPISPLLSPDSGQRSRPYSYFPPESGQSRSILHPSIVNLVIFFFSCPLYPWVTVSDVAGVGVAMSSHARQVMATSRKRKERDGSDAPTAAKAEPPAGNRILAGYLAHEYLTQGTLFGQRWDPADSKKPDPARAREPGPLKAYAEVACLLKAEGAHIPGVVNPTQLARWLQM